MKPNICSHEIMTSLCEMCTPETHTYMMIGKHGAMTLFTAPSFEKAKSIAFKKGAIEVYYRLSPNTPDPIMPEKN